MIKKMVIISLNRTSSRVLKMVIQVFSVSHEPKFLNQCGNVSVETLKHRHKQNPENSKSCLSGMDCSSSYTFCIANIDDDCKISILKSNALSIEEFTDVSPS